MGYTPRVFRRNDRIKKMAVRIRELEYLDDLVLHKTNTDAIKDEAMKTFIDNEIAKYNSAIRRTNGKKPGETDIEYRRRLIVANSKKHWRE